MRPIRNALAASIALALVAGAATAATTTTTTTTTTPATTTGALSIANGNGTTGTFVPSNTPAVATTPSGANTATSTSVTTTSSASNPATVTYVDVRNQRTLAATAGTHASGSTSAIDNLIAQGAATANASTTGTTSGTGTGTTAGTTGAVVTTPFIGGYAFGNPSDVTTLPYATTTTVPVTNSTLALNTAPDLVANAQVTQFEAARNDANVNRAIAQVQRDRKRIGRNGQLLYSIAPRTNVDRSAEMPDDGPPPSLTGSYSTLTR